MKTNYRCFTTILGLAGLGWGWAAMAVETNVNHAAAQRIGIYDSRAVAVAFAGSPAFKERMAPLIAAHNKAMAAGDTNSAKECEAKGRAMQTELHKQGFSTAPVDDLLAYIKPQMADISRTSAVQVIVSKWDTNTLAKFKDAEKVDVTMPLVEAFQPNERGLKFAVDIQQHPPVSLKEAEADKD